MNGYLTIVGGVLFSCSMNASGSIIIPDGVTEIGDSAFTYCSSLKSIVIPDSVTSIGEDAFWGCSSLESIVIPDGVTSIGDEAFTYSSLKSIVIPDGVTGIGSNAFADCSSLESIIVSPGNPVYDSRDNCNAIIETSTNRLIAKCRSTVLPDGIS